MSCASSTCSLPSLVAARLANMSSIRLVRSITLTPSAFSRFFCWEAVSSPSAMARSTSSVWQESASSAALPLPINVAVSGCDSFWVSRETITAPAVSASAANSFRLSSPSMDISMTRSASWVMPPSSMAFWTRSSLSSISLSHALWSSRPGFTGPSTFTESWPYSLSPRNAAVMPVHTPFSTPTAHMASKRSSLSACMSTADRRALPPGWVWMHLKPVRRSKLRRKCIWVSPTWEMEPTATSSTSPLRSRYTIISRFSWVVKLTSMPSRRSGRNRLRSNCMS